MDYEKEGKRPDRFLRSKSFHCKKFPSISLLRKDFFEISFGIYIGEERFEIGWDVFTAPERIKRIS